MESLWVGSDVDLSILHKCRMADRLEYRLTCLHKKNGRKGDFSDKFLGDMEKDGCLEDENHFRRRRRSGTWP